MLWFIWQKVCSRDHEKSTGVKFLRALHSALGAGNRMGVKIVRGHAWMWLRHTLWLEEPALNLRLELETECFRKFDLFLSYKYFFLYFPCKLECFIWQVPTTWSNRLHTRKEAQERAFNLQPGRFDLPGSRDPWTRNRRHDSWNRFMCALKQRVCLKITSWPFV